MAFADSDTYTDAQILAHVRAAIVAITLGGQSYTMPGGRSVTRANLKELRELKAEMESAIDITAGDTSIVLVAYGERS